MTSTAWNKKTHTNHSTKIEHMTHTWSHAESVSNNSDALSFRALYQVECLHRFLIHKLNWATKRGWCKNEICRQQLAIFLLTIIMHKVAQHARYFNAKSSSDYLEAICSFSKFPSIPNYRRCSQDSRWKFSKNIPEFRPRSNCSSPQHSFVQFKKKNR